MNSQRAGAVVAAVSVAALLAAGLVWMLPSGTDAPSPPHAAERSTPRPAAPGRAPEAKTPSPAVPAPGGERSHETQPEAVPDAVRDLLVKGQGEENVPEEIINAPISVWPISKEGIQGAVEEVAPAVEACYEDALDEVPDLAGELVVTFEIVEEDGVGQVWTVDLAEDSLDDGPVSDCVLKAMNRLQFDAPDGGSLDVTYPFRFSPDD